MSQILRHLERNRQVLSPNLSDCVEVNPWKDGWEWMLYADGSELLAQPNEGIYHFLTAEGLKKRREIGDLLHGKLKQCEQIGKGKGEMKYGVIRRSRDIVAKVANAEQFNAKEKHQLSKGSDFIYEAADDLFSVLEVYRLWKKHGYDHATQYGFTLNESSDDYREVQWMEYIDAPYWGAVYVITNCMAHDLEVYDIGYPTVLVDQVKQLIETQFNGNWDEAYEYIDRMSSERKEWGLSKGEKYKFNWIDGNPANIFCLPSKKKGELSFKLIDPFLRISKPRLS